MQPQSSLTRAHILSAIDLQIEAVPVPEWGGAVYVRNLNGRDRDRFEGSRIRIKQDRTIEMIHDNTRATLLSLTLCDAEGALLFTEEDVAALGQKNAGVLDRLFDVAQRLSSLRPQDVEAKEKNSVAAQAVNSSSVSPLP